jgi:hypothetical protein
MAEETEVTLQAGEPPSTLEEPTADSNGAEAVASAEPSPEVPGSREAAPAQPDYVYALGRIEPRFPSLAIEKEFAQARSQAETSGMTDRQALEEVLSQRENRYLARQLCYLLTIEGLETYILRPGDSSDVDLLIEAIRPAPDPGDLDVVIGRRGPLAPPDLCNGMQIPMVAFDQIYSFDRDSLIKNIPRPEGVKAKDFQPAATELFDTIIQLADNAGGTDEHRALNYLAVRDPSIYARAAEEQAHDFSIAEVKVQSSALAGARNIVEVVFAFTNRKTDFTESFFLRVDVTEMYPFLVTKLSPYYAR